MAGSALMAAAIWMVLGSSGEPVSAVEPPRDLYRPWYHFTPPKNWMNDPNGLVYLDGEYHLFYQYNPEGISWGHMSWGHAVSPDLVRWKDLPVALPESDGVMIFSGSAVVDAQNTSGFGDGHAAPMVAIYTGHRPSDGNQSQCLAYSVDRGRTWTKYAHNPVIDIGSTNFRDPKVNWHQPTGRWTMVVAMSEERKVRFYQSSDLKAWEQTGEFGPAGGTVGVWECPDLFPLPATDGAAGSKWVLIVNVGWGGPQGGNGCQYFVGSFDGKTFVPDTDWDLATPVWLDQGRDFYAAVTWSGVPVLEHDREPRRILLGWMVNGEYAGSTPTYPWRSAMTVPRELTLQRSGRTWRVAQSPVRELQSIRGKLQAAEAGSLQSVNTWIQKTGLKGDSLELDMTFRVPEPARGSFGVVVRKGADQQTLVGYDLEKGQVFIDRTRSGNVSFHDAFAGRHAASAMLDDGRCRLRVLVDVSSVEVFAQDGQVVLTDLVYPSQDSQGVELWAEGANVEITGFEAWDLNKAIVR